MKHLLIDSRDWGMTKYTEYNRRFEPVVYLALRGIFEEGELDEEAVVRKFRTTAFDKNLWRKLYEEKSGNYHTGYFMHYYFICNSIGLINPDKCIYYR